MNNSVEPSFHEIELLWEAARLCVHPNETDGNGHMNVRAIYAHGVDGADRLAETTGIDDAYRSRRLMGTFAAEHHIGFRSELRKGEQFTVHPTWVDRSERAAHMMVFTLNATNHVVSSILELLVVNVDLRHRSAVPFPRDVADEIDRVITQMRPLTSLSPSGAIGLRR